MAELPRMTIRMSEDLQEWLRDYAERNETTMTEIIKSYLVSLRKRDRMQQRKENNESEVK